MLSEFTALPRYVARTLSESALPSIGWTRFIGDEPSAPFMPAPAKATKRFVRALLTMFGKVRFTGQGQFQATGSSGGVVELSGSENRNARL